MTPHQGFLQAIREDPDDDTPRLVYADWLEENGDEPRDAFIRLGCALARLPRDHPDYHRLLVRESSMIETWKEEWFGPFRQRCAYWECRRGFMDEVHLDAVPFVAEGGQVFSLHPIRIVHLLQGGVPLRDLAECPHLAFVTKLALSRTVLSGG